MRKQEFIHLHALLAEVSNDVRERGYPLDLEAYREEGVRPTAIHNSKTDHKEAVQALAASIIEAVDDEPEREAVAPAAD